MKSTLYNLILVLVAWFLMHETVTRYEKNILLRKAEIEGRKIERIIDQYFNYVGHINNLMGKEILASKGKDLNLILKIFKENTQNNVGNEIFSWSMYNWIDNRGMQMINVRKGVYQEPFDLSFRKYNTLAFQKPWSLVVTGRVIGYPSTTMILPIATGVVDDDGNNLGIIVEGVNIALMENNLESKVDNNISFIVGDEEGYMALKSSAIKFSPAEAEMYDGAISKYITSYPNIDITKKPFLLDGINFQYLLKMSSYPLYIFTGFDKNILEYEVSKIVKPMMIGFILLLVAGNLLIFTSRHSKK